MASGAAGKPAKSQGFWRRLASGFVGEKEPLWHRVGSRVLTFYGLLSLSVVLLIAVWAIWAFISTRPASLALAFYDLDASGNPVISDGAVELELTDGDLARGYLEIPLRLAVRNEGKEIAPVTKVVTRLRPDIEIATGDTATRKIDPTGLSIVYERPIAPLHPEADWTPFEEIDVIPVRIFSFDTVTAAASSDLVPVLVKTTFYGFVASRFDIPPLGLTTELLPITVEFVGADGVIASSQLQLEVPFDIAVSTDYDGIRQRAETCPDDLTAHIHSLLQAAPLRDVRVENFAESGLTLRYLEFGPDEPVEQIAELDGVARVANLDLDGNGLLDHGAVWPAGGEQDCFRFEPEAGIEPWPDAAFQE